MNFSSKSIRRNLKLLDKKYNLAISSTRLSDSLEAALFAKLALMELCGWIEETIDCILMDYIERNISSPHIRHTISSEIVQRVYGFKYKDQFRPLMEKILGAHNFQKIILNLGKTGARDELLKSIFADLSENRNRAAHTHWQTGITLTYDAPSRTIDQLNKLLPIFHGIERMIKRM